MCSTYTIHVEVMRTVKYRGHSYRPSLLSSLCFALFSSHTTFTFIFLCSPSPPHSSSLFAGIRQTVHDAAVDLCAHMGQPPPPEVPEAQGVLEMLFEALSKHLSVIETMAAMWGE